MNKSKTKLKNGINTIERKALGLLDTIAKRSKKYRIINNKLSRLQGHFASQIDLIDVKVEGGLVDLLDTILGDELASYYLRGNQGAIYPIPNHKYKIETIADVETFIVDRRRTRDFTRNLKSISDREYRQLQNSSTYKIDLAAL